MAQQQSPDQATVIFRIEALERLVHDLQSQLQQYVRTSENDLHLRSIKDTVERIERELGLAKQQLTDSNKEMGEQFSQLKDEQNKLQVQTLTYIITTIVTIVGLVLVGVVTAYLTGAIH